MTRPIYVIGHRNSDMDAVASAYAYAHLLQVQGEDQAIAARHGELKPEVRFVLERFRIEPPEALEDVYLQVRDVMGHDVIAAYMDQPLLEAGRLLQKYDHHTMPVIDAEKTVHGVLTTEDFSKLFFNNLDVEAMNHIPLYRDNLIYVLQGRILVEGRRKLRNCVVIGAMQTETMSRCIDPGCLVVLGDREDAQLKAIECGAAALIVTNSFAVTERVLTAAQEEGVLIISTAYDTFSAVRLIHVSINTQDIMTCDFDYCRQDDQIGEVQHSSAHPRSMPVLDGSGKLVGYLSHTDLLNAQPKQVVLVDHNEQAQAVDGIDQADVVGIIDHHRIADVHTHKPIMFRAEPVGCTGTIIVGLYHEAAISIPPAVAGLLLAGLLYDTLILRSPTCTTRDERVAAELAAIAGEDIEQFGQEIFAAAATGLNERTTKELITSDYKEFTVRENKVAIGTIETASPVTVEKRIEELLATMEQYVAEQRYSSLLLMIVDIIHMRCRLLIWGNEHAVAEVFGVPLEADGHSIVVEGLVSRKKQVVPLLPRIQLSLAGATARA